MNSLDSFIKLKYEILTCDTDTWHLCRTYPIEVQRSWAWRCATDAECMVKDLPVIERCIEVTKRYRNNSATKEELDTALDTAWTFCMSSDDGGYFTWNAYSVARAFVCAVDPEVTALAVVAQFSARAVSCNGNYSIQTVLYTTKWDLYIEWLVEELRRYHST